MREYARISPRFWVGSTGRAIKAAGTDAQLVALYLLSGPHSNMIGMYWCPKMYIAHETGLSIEGASVALARLQSLDFCSYDDDSEVVWVHEMARFQIGEALNERDKQAKGVQNAYDDLPENPFLWAFFERYGSSFNMTKSRGIEGASEGHRSKAQAQATAQATEQATAQASVANAPAAKAAKFDYDPLFELVWAGYPDRPGKSKKDAYKAWSARIKAGVDPVVIASGLERYSAYCTAMKIEPQYIKQPETFFGPSEHYLGEWPCKPTALQRTYHDISKMDYSGHEDGHF